MILLVLVLAISLIYMELIYHVQGFGFENINLLLLIPSVLLLSGIETVFIFVFRRKHRIKVMRIVLIINFLIYSSQLVYLSVFKQPLLFAAIVNAGGMALTSYWRETFVAILNASVYILLLLVPNIIYEIIVHKNKEVLIGKKLAYHPRQWLIAFSPIVIIVLILNLGYQHNMNFYGEYQEFYDPLMLMQNYGVLPTIQRDLAGDSLPENERADLYYTKRSTMTIVPSMMEQPYDIKLILSNDPSDINYSDILKNANDKVDNVQEEFFIQSEEETILLACAEDIGFQIQEEESLPEASTIVDETVSQSEASNEPNLTEKVLKENALNIDFEKLENWADSKSKKALVEGIKRRVPTMQNDYTGMFKGYNLIYLTAEGFSTYAIDKELTPTLYKLTHSGVVATNYYVPLWQTSTSDGEYVNLTGLIPDKQFSMKRSAQNEQPFSIPAYFAKEGVKSYAYHNNTLGYYDRHLSHPNLGYDFKACKLGGLPQNVYGDKIFQMEGADYWPASDLSMMEATIPEYVDDERFCVYYMTVSGHMNYNFKGNRMSSKNRSLVANLPYSEEGRAYIACNIELDRALEYLISELDKHGKLDNTLIVLSADHYPYGMDVRNLEELAGKPLANTLDILRNSLILWNNKMETIEITKPCCSVDIIPTLYNLFGFEYDSRFYSGNDIFSDFPGLVIMSDRSFVTDKMWYNKKTGKTGSNNDESVDKEYSDLIKKQVKDIYEYSGKILVENFYAEVKNCILNN